MKEYSKIFWQLFVRKETPDNVNSSQSLLIALVFICIAIDLLISVIVGDSLMTKLVASSVLIGCMFILVMVTFKVHKHSARFQQTMCALLGVQLVYKFFIFPSQIYITQKVLSALPEGVKKISSEELSKYLQPDFTFVVSAIFIFVVFIMLVRSSAKILAYALEKPFFYGLIVYCSYFFISYTLAKDAIESFTQGSLS